MHARICESDDENDRKNVTYDYVLGFVRDVRSSFARMYAYYWTSNKSILD